VNWYHPIFGDVLTIPNGVWQTFLTILGAAIGALVAGWIAVKIERARELERARDEFAVFIIQFLNTVKSDFALDSLWRMKMDGVKTACAKLWVRLDAESRAKLEAALNDYCSINSDTLKAKEIRGGNGKPTTLDYTPAREAVAAPLLRMLETAKRSL
jgi:hypothetical protein